MIGGIVIGALQIIANAAPGFLAALTNRESDAEAIAHAERAIKRIPDRPAGTVIDRWREHLEATRHQ